MNVELTKKMWIVLTGLTISFVYKTNKNYRKYRNYRNHQQLKYRNSVIISNWNIEITENNKLRPLDGPYDFLGF